MVMLRAVFFNLPALAAAGVGAVLAASACGLRIRRATRLLWAMLFLVLALHAAVFLNATLAYVAFPYEGKSVVEGVVLYNSMRYLEGEQSYHPPGEAPFRSLVYPPVHEMALAAVVWLLGPSLMAGRLFSLVCALATAAVSGLVVWRHTRNPSASILGGMFCICCYGVCGHWMEQIRNDALLALLLVLGLYRAERAVQRGRMPVAGGILLLLAVYTKQTAILGPAAVAVHLWLRSRRRAIAWVCGFLVGGLAAFIAMEAWSGGWFSFYALRVPAEAGIDPANYRHAATFFGATWIVLWGILLVALPPMLRRFRRPGEPDEKSGLWMLAFALALPLTLLQSLKWGAALNAFVPLVPIMAVLGGMAVHALMQRFEEARWVQVGILAAAVMQVAMISYQPILPGKPDVSSQERIAQWVRAAPGDAFVSVFSSQVYLNGKKYFGDNVPIGDLERGGLWQGGDIVEKTRRGEFALLVLRPRIEPADLAEAVLERYAVVERIPMRATVGGWPYMNVYVPRGSVWRPADTGPTPHRTDGRTITE